jgi:hypothetical protein
LAHLREISDMESQFYGTRFLFNSIEQYASGWNQVASTGQQHNAQQADNWNAFVRCQPSTLALVDKQAVRAKLNGEFYRFGLADIDDKSELSGLSEVLYGLHAKPWRQLRMAPDQFITDCGRNDDFTEKLCKEALGTNSE